jgi:hypothetical protein
MRRMWQFSGSMVFMGQSPDSQMSQMYWNKDAKLYTKGSMTITKSGGIKVYTFGNQDKGRRLAWYAKVTHQDERDPLECRGCSKHVEQGDRVVTRLGKGYSHIYHHKCAREKHVI